MSSKGSVSGHTTGVESRLRALGIDIEFSVFPPRIAQILEIRLDDESAFDKLHTILQQEPSYAARVLSMANSLMFGSRHEITKLRAALTRLGTATTKNILLGIAVTEHLRHARPLLIHSVATGAFAYRLCHASKVVDAEVALCAGLLHDIGKTVLLQATKIPLHDKEILSRGGADALEDERKKFGTDHAEIGAWFSEKWALPRPFIEVIRDHHSPSPDSDILTRVIAIANEWTQNYYSSDFSSVPDTHKIIAWVETNLGLSREEFLSAAEQTPHDVTALTRDIEDVEFDAGEVIRTLQRANLALGEVNAMAELLRLQTQQQLRQLSFLQELSSVASAMVGQRHICDAAVQITSRKLGMRVVSLLLRNAKGRPYIEAAIGLPPEIIGNPELENGGPIVNWVIANREGLLLTDLTKSSEFGLSAHSRRYTTNSLLSVPVIHGSDVLGVLNLNNKAGDIPFNEEDLSLFETVGRNLGALLHVEQERTRRERADVRFRSLAAKTPLALVGFDLHGTVWLWNHGAHVLTGIAPSEALGTRVPSVLLPNEDADYLARWLSEVRAGRAIDREECVLTGPDKEFQYVLYNVFPLDGNTLAVWSGANITREKVAQLSAQRRSAEIEATQHVLREVLLELQTPNVLASFVDHLTRATGVEKAAVLLYDEDSGRIACAADHGFNGNAALKNWGPALESILGLAIEGRTVLNNVAVSDSAIGKHFLQEFHIRNFAAAPVLRHGKTVGVVCVFNRRHGPFEGVDLPVLQDMANVAAISLQVSDTHSERVRNEQLRTVESMAVTYNHNVNNSLQVIQSEIDLASMNDSLSDSVKQSLADIAAAAMRIAQVNERLRMTIHPPLREYPGGALMFDVGSLGGSAGGATAH
jgi:putative nucleotidyltransferase with HDIG domain/PAS domain S-box-containing protein